MRQFDLLSTDVESTETLDMGYIIRFLAQYFPLWICCQNGSAQCAVEWKPSSLNVRRYAARLIHLNEYLASFLGATLTDKIIVNELNEIRLYSMPNRWYNQACVQGFGCDSINF